MAPARRSKADAECGCTPAVAKTPGRDSARASDACDDPGSIPTETSRPTPDSLARAAIAPGSSSIRKG